MHIVSSFIISFLSWYFLGGKVGLNVFIFFRLYLPMIYLPGWSFQSLSMLVDVKDFQVAFPLANFYQQFSDLNAKFLKNMDQECFPLSLKN